MNLGEYAESLFTTRCIDMGYIVSKPFSHYARYDLIVDVDNALQRVQVKVYGSYTSRRTINVKLKLITQKMKSIGLLFILKNLILGMYLPIEVVDNITQFSVKKNYKSKYNIFKNNFGFLRHDF